MRGFTLPIRQAQGFTLLELLIVIGILAILATVIILVLNPAELLRQGRDTQRISDLANINKTLSFLQADQPSASFGTSSTVYISLPDTDDANPADCDEYSLPSLPSGWSYYCALKSSYRKTDGTGWIPVNLTTLFSTGSPLSNLPIDPVNQVANGLYYTYVAGGSWKLTALFESEKQARKMANDGGPDNAVYEIGTDFELANFARGLVGYWKFDEGSGTTAADSSGYGNNGGWNGNAPYYTSSGKVGYAGQFDGSTNYVIVNNSTSLYFNLKSQITLAAWVKTSNISGVYIIQKRNGAYEAYAFEDGGNGKVKFRVGYDADGAPPGNSIADIASNSSITDNNWHFLVGVYDDQGSLKESIYVDGALSNQANLDSNQYIYDSGLEFSFGNYPWIPHFNGLIDDARIYNRALSAAEIKTIYNATK